MLGLGQVGWWSQRRVTQFQGHLLELRKVTRNTLGSVAWVDLVSIYTLTEVFMH